jgi:hypothetical protein
VQVTDAGTQDPATAKPLNPAPASVTVFDRASLNLARFRRLHKKKTCFITCMKRQIGYKVRSRDDVNYPKIPHFRSGNPFDRYKEQGEPIKTLFIPYRHRELGCQDVFRHLPEALTVQASPQVDQEEPFQSDESPEVV